MTDDERRTRTDMKREQNEALNELKAAGRNLLRTALAAETKFASLMEGVPQGLREQWGRVGSDAVKLAGQIESVEWRVRQELNRS